MNTNPLKPILFVSLLNSIYTIYQVLIQRVFQPFAIAAVVISGIFTFLYFNKPEYAGAFVFYSALPIYPIYFLTSALGLTTPPSGIGIYAILGVVYFVCIFVLWKLKKRYEEYLLNEKNNVSEENPV